MNQIQFFKNDEFGAIRTMSNEQGEVMFCGHDVALALGYTKPRNAIAQHVDEGDKTTALIQGSGSNYKTWATFINEWQVETGEKIENPPLRNCNAKISSTFLSTKFGDLTNGCMHLWS